MANKLQPIIDALESLSEKVKRSNTAQTTMKEQYGWNFPHLSANNIASIVDAVTKRVESIDPSHVNTKFNPDQMVSKIDTVAAEILPYFWNGNGTEAFRALTALLDWIDATFAELYQRKTDWELLDEKNLMPPELAKKIRSLNSRLNSILGNVDTISDKIAVINNAHESALSLPTDLESLEEARDKISELAKSAEKEASLVTSASDKVPSLISEVERSRDEAAKLVARTEDAYSAATTIGLGAAFDSKARSLAKSMWVWVGGLFVALGIGGGLGYYRFSVIEKLIGQDTSQGVIWLNLILTIFSVAAPVWFAWVATKQIGQRFRLSEDYAYKASVAKAYEGYRREAVRLDPTFERRLFESTLDRLDEAPLRFVELETHGSPWHEVFKPRSRKADEASNKTNQFEKVETPISDAETPDDDV